MAKESSSSNNTIQTGRPWIKVDYAILLRLREVDHFGWLRIAEEYRKTTGQFISRDTVQRRYLSIQRLRPPESL